MNIQKIPLARLHPARYNPRADLKPGDPEYDMLAKGIGEFGLVVPLVWNKRSGNLVGGHQRLKVLKQAGIKEVQVSVVDLPDDKEQALNIALNKISGEWDMPALKDLIEGLDTGDIDMDLTGWTGDELEDLMLQVHQGETEDDAVPEVKKSICKTGDLWELGKHRLLCGDATKEADVARLMGGDRADMVFTDPPYGIKVVRSNSIGGGGAFGGKKNVKKDGSNFIKANNYNEIIGDETTEVAQRVYRLCCSMGFKNMILWGGNYFADFLPPSRGWICWDKIDGVEGTTKNFSDIELAWSTYDVPARIVRHRWQGLLKASEYNEKRVHPTQKPIALAVECFELFKAGKLILDPLLGSGSTLIACEKTGRRCRGMEIDEHYCDVVIARWQDYTGGRGKKIK